MVVFAIMVRIPVFFVVVVVVVVKLVVFVNFVVVSDSRSQSLVRSIAENA